MFPGAEEPRLSLFSQVRDACRRTPSYFTETGKEREVEMEVEMEMET